MAESKRDENNVPTIIVVSKDDLETPVNVAVESATGAIVVEIG